MRKMKGRTGLYSSGINKFIKSEDFMHGGLLLLF